LALSLAGCAAPSGQDLASSAAREAIASSRSKLIELGDETTSNDDLVSQISLGKLDGTTNLIDLPQAELSKISTNEQFAGIYAVDSAADGVSVGLIAFGRGEEGGGLSYKNVYVYLCVDLEYDRSGSSPPSVADVDCPTPLTDTLAEPRQAVRIRY
jgi:hypothetical protein